MSWDAATKKDRGVILQGGTKGEFAYCGRHHEWNAWQQQLHEDLFGGFLVKQRPVKEAVSNSNSLYKQHLLHNSFTVSLFLATTTKEAFGLFRQNLRIVALYFTLKFRDISAWQRNAVLHCKNNLLKRHQNSYANTRTHTLTHTPINSRKTIILSLFYTVIFSGPSLEHYSL